jgi:hypothetical protein
MLHQACRAVWSNTAGLLMTLALVFVAQRGGPMPVRGNRPENKSSDPGEMVLSQRSPLVRYANRESRRESRPLF